MESELRSEVRAYAQGPGKLRSREHDVKSGSGVGEGLVKVWSFWRHACVPVSSQLPALIMLTCRHPWASLRTPSLYC